MTRTDSCPLCNGPARETEARVPIRIGQRSATVLATVLRCDTCGQTLLDAANAVAAQRSAANEIRRQEGLLSGDEVRSVRDQLGLTQAQFEHLLGVGPKTVVRWENGTIFQQRSTDILLRLVAEVPGVAEYLARLHQVALQKTAEGGASLSRPVLGPSSPSPAPPPSCTASAHAGTIARLDTSTSNLPAASATDSAEIGVIEIGPWLKRRGEAQGTSITITAAQLQQTDAGYPEPTIEAYGS